MKVNASLTLIKVLCHLALNNVNVCQCHIVSDEGQYYLGFVEALGQCHFDSDEGQFHVDCDKCVS